MRNLSRRRSAAEGSRLVERYEASGLTRREFAARDGVTMSALQYWLRKVRTEEVGGAAAANRFVEVIGVDATGVPMGGMSMEICGLTLRFESLPSPSYLASLAAAFAGQ